MGFFLLHVHESNLLFPSGMWTFVFLMWADGQVHGGRVGQARQRLRLYSHGGTCGTHDLLPTFCYPLNIYYIYNYTSPAFSWQSTRTLP